jgi:stearoyl-CoA desaturase (delta-9 desaturase)
MAPDAEREGGRTDVARTMALGSDERINWRTSVPFLTLHLVPLGAFLTGVTARAVVLCVTLYAVRMFFLTAGYHRYFAHRSFHVSRPVQFLLAFGGTTAAQKGPLWWAGTHRAHHRYADTPRDVHSPLKGFWWSHIGWILCDKYSATDLDAISDFARYPELRFLNRHDWIGPWSVAIGTFLVAGWSGLVVGFFLSTVLLWHATFTVNSLAHLLGRRRYATSDTSRNSLFVALLTSGEGWHNNHHFYPSSARQGFFWWEIDPTWYVLRSLSAVRLVRDLRAPPPAVRGAPTVRDGSFDIGMFRANWTKAAAALAASKATIGEAISDGVGAVGDSLASRRAALEEKLRADRAALDEFVASALRAAETLAGHARRGQREITQPR